jgi:outer membrane protein OmpA-like peptidoglycan-associated protein
MTHSTLTTMLKAHVGRLLAGGVLAAAMVACASGPTPQLADARKAYDQAEDSPAAERRPHELERAKIALDRAEREHDDNPGSAREKQLAQRAEYRARMVMARSNPDVRARHYDDGEARHYDDGDMTAAEAAELRRDRVAAETAEMRRERADAEATVVRRDHTDVEAAEIRRDRADAKVVAETRNSKAQDRKAAAALQNLGQVANVKQEPRGVVITLSGSVLFPTGERELSPVARKSLDQVADALAKQPSSSTFQVEGFTDNSGSPNQNEQLAKERAKAVADHLVQSGIDPARIQVVSHGEKDPVANNDTPEGRATNRRVEIVVEQEG